MLTVVDLQDTSEGKPPLTYGKVGLGLAKRE